MVLGLAPLAVEADSEHMHSEEAQEVHFFQEDVVETGEERLSVAHVHDKVMDGAQAVQFVELEPFEVFRH